MSPRLRRLALTTHVTSSVGWIGAIVAYLALAAAGLLSDDVGVMRAAYVSMELVGWAVIVPFSIASLLTGLVESLGTEWGLFRYHWVQTKLWLTVIATAVLFAHMRAVRRMAGLAMHLPSFETADLSLLRVQLVVHALGGLFILLAATALSIYKPWGRTAYGERKRLRPQGAVRATSLRWIVIVVVVLAVAAAAIAHLHGTGPRMHGH